MDDLVRYWGIISDGAWFKGHFWLIMNVLRVCEWTDDEKLSDFQNSKNHLMIQFFHFLAKFVPLEWWMKEAFYRWMEGDNSERLTQTSLSNLHTWTSYARRNFKLKKSGAESWQRLYSCSKWINWIANWSFGELNVEQLELLDEDKSH